MASQWRYGPPSCSTAHACSLKPTTPRHDPSGHTEDAAQSQRDLPQWMRLYFYGMHGATLDVLLSSLHGALKDRDPKLVGFSSPYLCIMHSLSHFALEKMYKSRFRAPPVLFHLLLYPSAYIGLQILIGNIHTCCWVVSGKQLVVHYTLALYFSQVFHRAMAHLQYHPSSSSLQRKPYQGNPKGLPGYARFLFFGMHGFLDEILFTSLFNLVEKPDRCLRGHTSLWSFLMYGSCSFMVEKLYLHFCRGWRTWQRLPIYICLIYTWEFTWGLGLRQFGACSWDYSHYPHNFMGLITLLYLPGWVCLSLYQDVLSDVLLRITRTHGNCGSGANGELNGRLESKKKMV